MTRDLPDCPEGWVWVYGPIDPKTGRQTAELQCWCESCQLALSRKHAVEDRRLEEVEKRNARARRQAMIAARVSLMARVRRKTRGGT